MISCFEFIKKKRISPELNVSQALKIYKIFHLDVLEKPVINSLTSLVNEPKLPIIVHNEEKCEVENILNEGSFQAKI